VQTATDAGSGAFGLKPARAAREHRTDGIEDMAQVALSVFTIVTGQIWLQSGIRRIGDQQSRSRVNAGHQNKLKSSLGASHQGCVQGGPGALRADVRSVHSSCQPRNAPSDDQRNDDHQVQDL
jgi:hypothetical protein